MLFLCVKIDVFNISKFADFLTPCWNFKYNSSPMCKNFRRQSF